MAKYYHSVPYFRSITINKDYTVATLHYSFIWEGSSLVYKKNEDGKWEFTGFSDHGWMQ